MSITIHIEITDAPTPDIVHRFRNFGEDINRSLRYKCTVDINEIDKAVTRLSVRDIHKRDVGSITKIIEKELENYNFLESAKLKCVQITN